MKSKTLFIILSLFFTLQGANAQKVDYSVVSVPEEAGIDFLQVSTANDYVCMPIVKRTSSSINWATNQVLGVTADGQKMAYLSFRNNTSNIFIKALDKQGSSVQRTNRAAVQDFSFSPDGKFICFSERRGKTTQIFQTSAEKGYICRQITTGNTDYSPVYSPDMTQIIFARQEAKSIGIWSYNIKNNFLSSYTSGMNPCHAKSGTTIFCARTNSEGRGEIWKVNYETGTEECIVSDIERSFASPVLSPNGQWILFVGGSKISTDTFSYMNTDIYVVKIDGTEFTQLTYHAADDLSPMWSKDGKYIYFVSQRGSKEGTANIWRMTFNLF